MKGSGVKSAALRPTEDLGWSGWAALSPTARAKETFFANSAWMSFSSSGKLNPDWQSSGFHRSLGSLAEAVWQVVISGVNIMTPLTFAAWPSASPLVV